MKPDRGTRRNQAKNSSRAMPYTLCVIGEETLSSTIALNLSRSAGFSTTTRSVILGAFNGHYRTLRHVDITSVWRAQSYSG